MVNAGKYSTTFFVVLFSALDARQRAQRAPVIGDFDDLKTYGPFFYLWIFCSVVSSCYTYTWDVKMDWGLMDKNAGENQGLREEVVYSSKGYYYFAIFEDFLLRLGWVVALSFNEFTSVDANIIASILSPLEIFRRFVWNFFRLENEHLNNCGKSYNSNCNQSLLPLKYFFHYQIFGISKELLRRFYTSENRNKKKEKKKKKKRKKKEKKKKKKRKKKKKKEEKRKRKKRKKKKKKEKEKEEKEKKKKKKEKKEKEKKRKKKKKKIEKKRKKKEKKEKKIEKKIEKKEKKRKKRKKREKKEKKKRKKGKREKGEKRKEKEKKEKGEKRKKKKKKRKKKKKKEKRKKGKRGKKEKKKKGKREKKKKKNIGKYRKI